jgi:flagellar M-ring protein FliF
VVAAGPDGVATWRPRSEDELRQLTALARNAVGFDEKRGDKVDVVSLRFVTPAADEVGPPTVADRLAAWGLAPSALLRLAEAGLLTLVVLAALLLVARPVMLRLAQPAELPPAEAPAAVPQLTDNAIEIARVDGALHEGSVRRIVDLVDKNPEASVAIVRGWMNGEAA